MFLESEYMATLNLMKTLEITQYPNNRTKFYKKIQGNIRAQISGVKQDQVLYIEDIITIELRYNTIMFFYDVYNALESGKLTNVHCVKEVPFTVSEFLTAYSQILNEIFCNASYEFVDSGMAYHAETAMDIVRNTWV